MTTLGTQMLEGLRLLEDSPGWLRQDRLERAMRKCVPEFTSGAMTLLEARAKRIRLEAAAATGWFMATVAGSENSHTVGHMIGAVDGARSSPVDAVRSGAQLRGQHVVRVADDPLREQESQCQIKVVAELDGLVVRTPERQA